MTAILDQLKEAVNPETATAVVLSMGPSLVAALVTLFAFVALVYVTKRVLDRVFRRVKMDETAAAFVQAVTRFGLITMGILTVLDQVGVDTVSILTSLGVLGLTLGFAAQNTLSNLISGLFIFWDRPFTIGDLIDIDGDYGRVETITLRSTRLITVDGRMLAIPNAVVANAKVASYTNFPHLRLDVDVTVGVAEPMERVRTLLLALVTDPAIFMSEPPPRVVVRELGDYFVRAELQAWIHDERNHVAERFRLRERIKATLDEAGVMMPYETLSIEPVHVVQDQARAAG